MATDWGSLWRDFKNKELVLKNNETSDIPEVEELCAQERFNIGQLNLRIYFESQPSFWIVCRNSNNAIVGVEGMNFLENNLVYGFTRLVDSKYRGLGIASNFDHFWGDFDRFIGSATYDSLIRFHFQKFLEKRHGFYGTFNPNHVPSPMPSIADSSIRIEPLDAGNFAAVCRYDRSLIQIDRSSFLRQWFEIDHRPPRVDCVAIAAFTSAGDCIGYGVLRAFVEYHCFSPVYAISDEIAWVLLCRLAATLGLGRGLYVSGLANNRLLFLFAKQFHLALVDTEMRIVGHEAVPYVNTLKTAQAYMLHEYYPL